MYSKRSAAGAHRTPAAAAASQQCSCVLLVQISTARYEMYTSANTCKSSYISAFVTRVFVNGTASFKTSRTAGPAAAHRQSATCSGQYHSMTTPAGLLATSRHGGCASWWCSFGQIGCVGFCARICVAASASTARCARSHIAALDRCPVLCRVLCCRPVPTESDSDFDVPGHQAVLQVGAAGGGLLLFLGGGGRGIAVVLPPLAVAGSSYSSHGSGAGQLCNS